MSRAETTELLLAARDGDDASRAELFERLYDELHAQARAQLRRGREGAVDTTELVHEAYLKLCDADRLSAADRGHFLALSARVMRQILVDHFRARSAGKRGGGAVRMPLDVEGLPSAARGELVLGIDEALGRLSEVDDRAGRVVELKFFGGLSEPEIARELDVSVRTVSSEWRKARAFLTRELGAS